MAITLETIETKEFSFVQNGFNPDEVDDFLDEIMAEMQRLMKENEQLNRELKAARSMPVQEPTQVVRPVVPTAIPVSAPSDSFREILETAQRVKEETIAKAKEQADEIRRNAQSEIESRLGNLTAERDRLMTEIESMRASGKTMKENLQAMINASQALIDKNSDLF